MKTKKDLEGMKKQSNVPFGNQYEYFFNMLEDLYISKSDGLSRIKQELYKWDKESASNIVEELINRMVKNGTIMFDIDELSELSDFYNEI